MTTVPTTTTAPRNGLGTAGMVLGIIAAAIGLIPFLGLLSFLVGPLAVILGAVGWTRTRGARPTADNPVASMFGVGLGALGVLFAVAMFAGMNAVVDELEQDGALAPFPAGTSDAINEVKVTACNSGDGPLGMSGTTVAVTNGTDRAQTYLITVSLNNADGNRLGEAIGAVNAVAPGQTATSDLFGGGTDTEGVTACTVANVDRVPS